MLGWLKAVLGRGEAPAVGLHLAAFGKHPGWNDHLDDQGIHTERLVEFKRRLYVEGIGGNIDAGTWAADADATEANPLRHIIVWHDGASVILARMWPSVDGKGRSAFPMVVCVEAIGIDVQWAINSCLPLLEKVESSCRAARTAEDVIEALDQARQDLIRVSAGIQPIRVLDETDRTEGLIAVSNRVRGEGGTDAVHRLLHRLVGMLGEPAEQDSSSPPMDKPQHVRVPRAASQPGEAAWSWLRVLSGWGGRPALLIMPLRHKFIDLIVGPPGRGELACLRTPDTTIPLVTTIPYSITPGAADRFEALLRRPASARERSA